MASRSAGSVGSRRWVTAPATRVATGQAVLVDDAVAGDGGDALARGDDPGEVQRVGAGEGDQGAVAVFAADGAERVDGLGQGVLLAGELGDEAPAANLAAGLHPAPDSQEVAPRRQPRLPLGDLVKHDAVALEQLSAPELGDGERAGGVLGIRRGVLVAEERPAPAHVGRDDGLTRPSPWRAAGPAIRAGPRRDEAPEAAEAVAGDQSGVDELPQRGPYLGVEPMGRLAEILGEAGAAPLQIVQDFLGQRADLDRAVGLGRGGEPRVEAVAEEQRDG